jgi:hypothetical protein
VARDASTLKISPSFQSNGVICLKSRHKHFSQALFFSVLVTRESPLKETVLGVFYLADIVAKGSKNK